MESRIVEALLGRHSVAASRQSSAGDLDARIGFLGLAGDAHGLPLDIQEPSMYNTGWKTVAPQKRGSKSQ
jgi:hypothetical protein